RADRHVHAVRGGDARQQRGDERLRLGDRLVHLPVARDQRTTSARAHDNASTPGSRFPSSSSSDAPPPVERCVTSSASPNCCKAAALSPPPTTVTPGACATASATARVPSANGSSSNAPIGLFQKIVPAPAISRA